MKSLFPWRSYPSRLDGHKLLPVQSDEQQRVFPAARQAITYYIQTPQRNRRFH
jgi:hypothetical protein